MRSYSDDEIDALAQELVNGQKCQADLQLTSEALISCNNDVVKTQPSFWQQPETIGGAILVALLLGFGIGEAVK
jgi:hypothetical protein